MRLYSTKNSFKRIIMIDNKYFVIEDGTCKVMVSAPHAVNHYRNGKMKYADIHTGAITSVLHERCGCPVIYTCAYAEADANWDEFGLCKYKQALKKYVEENDIKILIDIHGSKESSDLAFEFGTMNQIDILRYKNQLICELLENSLRDHITDFGGKSIGTNIIFHGKNPTVTKCISLACNIPCVQIEINRLFREGDRCTQMLNAFVCTINKLKEMDWCSL